MSFVFLNRILLHFELESGLDTGFGENWQLILDLGGKKNYLSRDGE